MHLKIEFLLYKIDWFAFKERTKKEKPKVLELILTKQSATTSAVNLF